MVGALSRTPAHMAKHEFLKGIRGSGDMPPGCWVVQGSACSQAVSGSPRAGK